MDINIVPCIKNPTQKTYNYAYNKDNYYVNYLKSPTIGQYMEAFKADNSVLDYMNCVIDW